MSPKQSPIRTQEITQGDEKTVCTDGIASSTNDRHAGSLTTPLTNCAMQSVSTPGTQTDLPKYL